MIDHSEWRLSAPDDRSADPAPPSLPSVAPSSSGVSPAEGREDLGGEQPEGLGLGEVGEGDGEELGAQVDLGPQRGGDLVGGAGDEAAPGAEAALGLGTTSSRSALLVARPTGCWTESRAEPVCGRSSSRRAMP